jgi:hypothetical protein
MANYARIFRKLMTVSVLGFTISASALFVSRDARADHQSGCSHELKHRTAEQTVRDHVAAIQAGNIDQAMCDFAEDAAIILPGQVVTGLDNSRGGLSGISALLGGAVPQISTLTATSSVVLLTFTAFGTPCIIPDGSDTYVVDKGKIVTQTVHDTFFSAPGHVCPAAAPGS